MNYEKYRAALEGLSWEQEKAFSHFFLGYIIEDVSTGRVDEAIRAALAYVASEVRPINGASTLSETIFNQAVSMNRTIAACIGGGK
jgi:hypothetical protein